MPTYPMSYRLKSIVTKAALAVLLVVTYSFISCHSTTTSKEMEGKAIDKNLVANRVSYIDKTPIIDGQLDAGLEHLGVHEFNYIWQFDNPITDTAHVTYRMAYTPYHLYVYIETDVDSISYHRRGNLWGDGYKVLLGIPQKDSLTNEYYELYFSPTVEKEYEWARQGIMYYNFDQVTNKLSDKTKSQEKAQRDISGFEALIAWEDIKPYHPWFLEEMGYNIYFAKGIESKEHDWITNGYSLVEDEGIWDEEVPKRNYEPITFEDPISTGNQVICAMPKESNLKVGEPLIIEIASIGRERSRDHLSVFFSDINANPILSKKIEVQLDETLKKEKYFMDIGNLEPGRYNLTVQNSNDTILKEAIVIQPTINFQNIAKKIRENRNGLKMGTTNTLQFELNQVSSKLSELKKYETGEDIIEDWTLLQEKYNLFITGVDPYENVTEPYRRAFKSKYDNTYQPYSIKLPKEYDPSKQYPLLVFMHGSGRDEQGLLDRPRSGGDFIEIAPLARDVYRAYAEDYSQRDIIEAIDDVSEYFAVDKRNIIIGGFSMGGYGALRTFYEHPELYKGVVVHAGHPNLANEWLDGEYPNFLDEKYLAAFSDIPVFIYHGKKDPACDVRVVEEMSSKLHQAGARITKSIVAENGHEYPDKETNKLYFEWLNSVIAK